MLDMYDYLARGLPWMTMIPRSTENLNNLLSTFIDTIKNIRLIFNILTITYKHRKDNRPDNEKHVLGLFKCLLSLAGAKPSTAKVTANAETAALVRHCFYIYH